MNVRKIIKILFVISVLVFLLVSAYVIFSGNRIKVQYIGDDSFYYLNLAKHFVDDGFWSFDNFHTPATGFHIFNAYFISLVYLISHNNLLTVLPALYTFLFLLFVAVIIYQSKSDNVVLIVTLILSSLATLINVISFMEWIWTLIFSALLFYVFYYRKPPIIVFIVSLLGILARSDFVILLLSFALVSLRERKNKSTAIVSFLSIISGVLFYAVHSYLISSNFLQSSISAKLHRALLLGISPFPFILQVIREFVGFNRLHLFDNVENRILFYHFLLLFVIVLTLLLFLSKKLRKIHFNFFIHSLTLKEKEILLISLIALLFYTIFYSFNSFGMQIWYGSVVLVPISILIYFLLEKMKNKILTGIIFVVILFNLSVTLFSQPFNKEQVKAFELANVVKERFDFNENTRFAAWDSGILGYFLHGQVVNLDGLVNSEVIPFLKRNELDRYLHYKKIEYLLQYPPEPAKFYGYSPNLKPRLIPYFIYYKNKKYIIYKLR